MPFPGRLYSSAFKVYFHKSLVKVDIGIAKGKKLYDKRESIAKNDQRRQAEKSLRLEILLCNTGM